MLRGWVACKLVLLKVSIAIRTTKSRLLWFGLMTDSASWTPSPLLPNRNRPWIYALDNDKIISHPHPPRRGSSQQSATIWVSGKPRPGQAPSVRMETKIFSWIFTRWCRPSSLVLKAWPPHVPGTILGSLVGSMASISELWLCFDLYPRSLPSVSWVCRGHHPARVFLGGEFTWWWLIINF